MLKPSSTVATPQVPALDRERRPNVDASGIVQSMQKLANASALPEVNAEPFVAAAGAMGKAIGGALMQTGDLVTAVAVKHRQERSRIALIQAEGEMSRAGTQLSGFYEQHRAETGRWIPEADRLTKETLTKLQSLQDLTGEDKARLLANGIEWRKGLLAHAQSRSMETDFRASRDLQRTRMESLRAQGRIQEADQALQESDASGLFFEHEIEAEKEGNRSAGASLDLQRATTAALDPISRNLDEARRIIKESPHIPESAKALELAKLEAGHATAAERDEVQALTYKDPAKAEELLNDPTRFPRLSPGDRAAAKEDAMRARHFMGQAAVSQGKEFVDMLNPKELAGLTPEGLEKALAEDKGELGRNWAQTSAHDRFAAKTYLAVKQGKARMNDEGEFMRAATAIDLLPAGNDAKSQLEAATVMQLVGVKFSGAYLEALQERFEKHTKSPEEGLYLTGPALAQLDKWIDAGAAGVVDKPVLDKAGNQIFRDPKTLGKSTQAGQTRFGLDWLNPDDAKDVKENDGKPIPLTEPDPIAKARAIDQRKRIADRLKIEIDAGRIKSGDEAQEFVARQAILAGWTLPAAAPREGSAVPSDETLPRSAGDMSAENPILPPISQEEALQRFRRATQGTN